MVGTLLMVMVYTLKEGVTPAFQKSTEHWISSRHVKNLRLDAGVSRPYLLYKNVKWLCRYLMIANFLLEVYLTPRQVIRELRPMITGGDI